MKKKLPLVSVIVPVYNEEKYLDYCLSTLNKQTYSSSSEIILIDDGSTDKSTEVAKKYNIKIIKQSHLGPGAARNKGAAQAQGEILVFADADMKYKKNYIEKLIEPILNNGKIGTFVKEELVANPENIWSRCWSINSGLPFNRRLPENYRETENAFRAILKKYFIKGKGYEINQGYIDDSSLSRKINILAVNARGAVSYHYNPSSLSEVFYSSRWIGRSKPLFKRNLYNFLRYSPVNSLRVSIKYVLRGAPFAIVLFKIVYDMGMLAGIFLSFGRTAR